VRAEIRIAPYGRLILDMSPYASTDPIDPTLLRIQLPAEATRGVRTDGYYDVWVANRRIARGPAINELSISILPPRNVLSGSWTPVMSIGDSFTRSISLVGLFPDDEDISVDLDHPPDLNIQDIAGRDVVRFIGLPHLWVEADREAISLALSEEDVATIGPGRFTYTLHAWNTLHEPRTLIAGVLLVSELVLSPSNALGGEVHAGR
jgi:hypothetical protein